MSDSKKLKIALLQTELVWEDAQANLKAFGEELGNLSGNYDLIVLPEMFNTGFTMNAQSVAETMDGRTVKWLCEKSTERKTVICGSIIIAENGNFYNRFVWAESGVVNTKYDKRHLFRMADEHHTFSGGTQRSEVSYKGWQIMPRVCYDLRFPVWNRSAKIDLQIYVANWPEARVGAWDKLLMARAIENQCYVVGVNRIGTDGKGIGYNGHSIIIDPKGMPISPENNEKSGWITAEIDLESLDDFRKKFPVSMDSDEFEIRLEVNKQKKQ